MCAAPCQPTESQHDWSTHNPMDLFSLSRVGGKTETQSAVTAVREITITLLLEPCTNDEGPLERCLWCCTATDKSTAVQPACKFRPKVFCGALHGAFKRNCHHAHAKSEPRDRAHPKQSAVPYSLPLHLDCASHCSKVLCWAAPWKV